jgi:fucose permease
VPPAGDPPCCRLPPAVAGCLCVSQVYGGGLIPIVAGFILRTYGVHEAYLYIGALVMVYAVLAIYAILATPETKGTEHRPERRGNRCARSAY